MNLSRQKPRSVLPIGIFDSGVGGLSVLNAILNELPAEDVIYLADQANVPYGSRSLEEVRGFSQTNTQYLLELGVKLVVVACNTASAAALHSLRQVFPTVPFVGMEPAVKPAAESTNTGIVGVLATPATFQGQLYASVIERFASGVKVLQDTCPGLVHQIEAGDLDTLETRAILEKALFPMLSQNVDKVVLGCTHYPFVIPLIEQITGPSVQVIDPAPAVARQVQRVLEQHGLLRSYQPNVVTGKGTIRFLTTGDADQFQSLLPKLLPGNRFKSEVVPKVGAYLDETVGCFSVEKIVLNPGAEIVG